jgi:hypothetical protein
MAEKAQRGMPIHEESEGDEIGSNFYDLVDESSVDIPRVGDDEGSAQPAQAAPGDVSTQSTQPTEKKAKKEA